VGKKRSLFIKVLFKIVFKVLFVFVLFLSLTLAFLTIIEYRPDDIEIIDIENPVSSQVIIGEALTLMTFNIGYAGLGKNEDFILDGGEKSRTESLEVVEGYMDGILNLLTEYTADFYLIQEVDLKARRSYNMNQVEVINDHLGNAFSSVFAYNFKAVFVPFPISLTEYIGPVESGLLTLSNKEITHAERQQFPGSFAWPVRIVNLKRAMLITYIPIEGTEKELVIVNLHMSAYDGDGSLRAQEMAHLKTFMEIEYEKGNYVIIGGDFNQTFPSVVDNYPAEEDLYVAYPIEETWLPSGFTFAIDETLPTCRLLHRPYNPTTPNDPNDPNTQYYIIDGFIVSDNILIELVYTVDHGFEYSDHNPVMLTVRLLP
jgi:endonuclease/exonuclease/phosphatase family metal-dependent hydrolase